MKLMKCIPNDIYLELCTVLYEFQNGTDNECEEGYLSDGEWLDVFYLFCVKLQKTCKDADVEGRFV